jgi:hypothetical protein
MSVNVDRLWLWTLVAAAALLIVPAILWFLCPLNPPKVTGTTQIMHDGFTMGNMVTDGARLCDTVAS